MTNWKTTLSGAGAALMSLLAIVAAAPAELSDVSAYLSPKWHSRLLFAAAVAAFALKMINSHCQADKPPKS